MANSAKGAASGAIAGNTFGPWGTVIGGGLGLAGSIIGGNSAKKAASSSTKWGLISQILQQQWEEKRAKNAHQWEIEDLHKAGLNPILSAGGQGAQTGSIGGINTDTSGISSAGQIMAQGLETAGKMAMDYTIEKQRLDNETATTKANTAKTLAESNIVEKYGGKKAKAEIKKLISDALHNNEDTKTKTMTNTIYDKGLSSAKNIANAMEKAVEITIDNIANPWWAKQTRKKKIKERLERSWETRKKSLGI